MTAERKPKVAASRLLLAAAIVAAASLAACGDDDTNSLDDRTVAEPVEVIMTDHAYAVTGPLRPGGPLLVRNDGNETHMMVMGRLHDGVTLDDLLEALQSDDESAADELVDEVGAPGNILTPGHQLEITAPDLTPGTYVMVCFFGTEGDGTPHVFNGMAATLDVEGDQVALAEGDVSYAVSPGETIDGPTQLDAGPRTLEISATGEAKALDLSLWRVDDGQTLSDVRDRVNELANADVPAVGSGRDAAQHLVGIVNALGDSGSLLLGVDLEPGTYILAAISTEDEGEPEGGTKEQIRITVT